MANRKPLTPQQKEVSKEMRNLRLRLGMTMPTFGPVVGMNCNCLNTYEMARVHWNEAKLKRALPALITHLEDSLAHVKSLATTLLPDEPPMQRKADT